MAFFKFRWPGQSEQPSQADRLSKRSRAPQAESIEAMRRRARHRLIGAAVLVLVGVIGFPLLFDTQPRPIPLDIPIEIPDRDKAAPLELPASSGLSEADRAASRSASPRSENGLSDGEEFIPAQSPLPIPPVISVAKPPPAKVAVAPAVVLKPEAKPQPARVPAAPAVVIKPEPKPQPEKVIPPAAVAAKTEPKPEAKPAVVPNRADEAARARALLEGKAVQTPAASRAEESRFIVQVGAFGDADKARDVRSKLERAGVKTYAQVVDTKDGKRTRVRVGPFASKAEADKAAQRIKSLDLSASVLTL